MKREKKVFLRNITLIVISAFLSYKTQAQCTELVWSDEFTGTTLNTSNWNYNVGNPGVNNELEYYTSRSQNISVSGGYLNITALKENYSGSAYTSGKLDSYSKQNFKYGRFEASIKLPTTQGLWPAFWMMPETSAYGSWPQSGEIDIMEEQGSNPYKNFGTIHYGPSVANAQSSGGTYTDISDLSAGFHTYAVEWKPDTINWYLDNHNYYTVTATSIAPQSWPFDQNFFIILNLAVGGWFGGDPDGTTIFPQTMQVDYVRVYTNPNSLFINGKDEALTNETYTYSVNDASATSYTWSVPTGSSIISGQGTDAIQVTWGGTSGLVSVDITTSCGTTPTTLSKNIPVIANGCDLIFDDFESNRLISYNTSTGTSFNPASPNPASDAVDASSTVANYKRNSIQYDILYYSTDIINNSVEYENGKRVLYMDVYTNAPTGTVINWQFENQNLTAQAYPSGRRAVFVGKTTVQNKWEKIKFSFSSIPDAATPSTSIDQFTFLFDPGNSTDTYNFYFDNLMRTDSAACSITTGTQTAVIDQQNLSVSPNPAQDQLSISMNTLAESADIQISLIDMLGIEHINRVYAIKGTSFETSINVSSLSPGIYMLLVQQGDKNFTSKKIIVQ